MKSTIEEAVGQLIIGKVPGTELDAETKHCLKSGTISGITVFKENVVSQEQLMDLCDAVRKLSWHPALIAVDQEGGAVQRLDEIVSPLPSMMALGNLDDVERLKLVITIAGKQMRLLGFNCVFAPVLDCNTNPANPIIGTRAFGADPDKVARLSAAVMRTYLDAGVLPVAKHFPGHGDTACDSHLELPRLSHSLERLEEIELRPFCENLLTTPAILVAHLWVECFDKDELPATLSHKICSELLKDKLGYQNLVVSDDMLMKAITNKWGLAEASVRALAAGIDLLLICSGPDDARAVHQAVCEAIKSGRISEERILAACRAKKAALNKLAPFAETERSRRLALLKKSVAASEPLLLETSSAAIDLSRGIPREVFAGTAEISIFVPQSPRYKFNFVEALLAEMPDLKGRLLEQRYSLSPDADEIKTLADKCKERCVLVTFRSTVNKGQLDLAASLYARSKERLLVASDIPYDLDLITDWDNAVSLFDPSDLAVRAFAKQMAKRHISCQHCGH